MEEFPTRPIEMCGDSTLEWVQDNSLKTTPAHSNVETLPAKIAREMRRIGSALPAVGGDKVIWQCLRKAFSLEVVVCDGRCSVRHCRGEV